MLALESHRARCLVVGEDLGTVQHGLRERLAAEDILSYRVLWFERDAEDSTRRALSGEGGGVRVDARPADDRGMVAGADIAEKASLGMLPGTRPSRERRPRRRPQALADALNRDAPPASARSIRPRLTTQRSRPPASPSRESPSELVLLQADDLAAEIAAQNLPGTDRERPNWRRKVSVDVAELWDTRAGRQTAAACATRRSSHDSSPD